MTHDTPLLPPPSMAPFMINTAGDDGDECRERAVARFAAGVRGQYEVYSISFSGLSADKLRRARAAILASAPGSRQPRNAALEIDRMVLALLARDEYVGMSGEPGAHRRVSTGHEVTVRASLRAVGRSVDRSVGRSIDRRSSVGRRSSSSSSSSSRAPSSVVVIRRRPSASVVARPLLSPPHRRFPAPPVRLRCVPENR